jgi:Uma2 family endonuclease
MLETSISVGEYLSGDFEPDVDYVDGHIEERNVGEREHGEMQYRITTLLKRTRKLAVYLETRIRVSPTRYRVPDICAYREKTTERVFTRPPLLCVEILSPEDRLGLTRKRVEDYLAIGVPSVWILDPCEKKAYVVDPAHGLREVNGEIATADGSVVLPLSEVFSDEEIF